MVDSTLNYIIDGLGLNKLTLVPVSFCVYIFFVGIFHCTNPYNL